MTDLRDTEIPPELDRWNWGAFLLNWIWGIGNQTYIALLTLIPFFGIIIMPFVLGAKGSRWAWKNGRWDSVEHFRRVQRAWAFWGGVIVFGMFLWVGGIMGALFYFMKHSEPYQLGATTLRDNAQAINALGTPISTGFPLGQISTSNSSGQATLSFSASGSKASGHVYLQAIRRDGVWSLRNVTLKIDGSDRTINLLEQTKVEIQRRRPSFETAHSSRL